MESNGNAPAMRVDFSIRVVMDAHSYTQVGALMDLISVELDRALRPEENAAFDFINFQTHPCKAMQMEQRAYHNESRAELAEIGPSPSEF